MSAYETIALEIDGSVGRVAFNRPEVLNAENPQLVLELYDALEEVANDDRVRVVLLTGRGRAFSSGIDLTALGGKEIERQFFLDWEKAVRLCETMDKPVVAGIHSYCLGGGVQIALGCDIRVCTPDSIFGLTAVKECLVPSLGVWRLPRYIGLGRAKRMVMTGENISAQEALEFGLVDFVVDDLEAKLTELCTVFTRVARTSFRHSKRLTNLAFDYDHDTMLADFIEAEMECVNSPENVEAMAAWREKREPNFA